MQHLDLLPLPFASPIYRGDDEARNGENGEDVVDMSIHELAVYEIRLLEWHWLEVQTNFHEKRE